MIRKFLLVVAWFPLTLLLLILNLAILGRYSGADDGQYRLNAQAPQDSSFQLTAGAGTAQVLSASVVAGDARVHLLESFLTRHKSPMSTFANVIVSEADRFGIDFRLVTAIAMCESGAGKRMPKKDEFNAWGIAVYTGQLNGKAFDDWPHAISWVSKYIKERYYDRGYTDLYTIGAIWAPPSVENGYSWTNCVEQFVGDII